MLQKVSLDTTEALQQFRRRVIEDDPAIVGYRNHANPNRVSRNNQKRLTYIMASSSEGFVTARQP